MDKINFAIVGCGNIADFHADALRKISDAQLVAVCDNVKEKVEALAGKYQAAAFSAYEELLQRKDIDVVNICLPSGLHEEFTVKAAEAGKHVIVEKPLDIDLGKCDRMIKTCRKNNVKLCVIFPSRFKKSSSFVKRALDEKRLGRLVLGEARVNWFRSDDYYASGAWRGTWKLDGGGAVMNQAIHSIDLLQYFMGDVESVFAYADTLSKDIEVEDSAVAVLRFKNNALGIITASTSAYPGFDAEIGIYGNKGSIKLAGGNIKSWEFTENIPIDREIPKCTCSTVSSGAKDPVKFIDSKGHQGQIENMIAAIKNDTLPAVDGHEGRKAVEIVSAIYKSAEEGREIKLPL